MAVRDVRFAFILTEGPKAVSLEVGRSLLAELIHLRGWPSRPSDAQLSLLGADLARVVNRSRPWSRSYLSNILSGRFPAGRFIFQAMQRLKAGAPLGEAVQLRGAPGVQIEPGALVLISSRRCEFIACQLPFIPTSRRQRFHSAQCRRRAWSLKRRGGN